MTNKSFLLSALILIGLCLISLTSFAAKKGMTPASKTAPGASLKTEMNFNDTSIKGKYHLASEAVVTVEDEKLIHDVLAPRSEFKDRIRESLETE